MAADAPNFVADWCGKQSPAGYEAFRTALADYRAAINDFQLTGNSVLVDLGQSCRPDQGKVGNRDEIDLIVGRLEYARPDLGRANDARNRMASALKQAFADDPQATAVEADISALFEVISKYESGIKKVQGIADLWAACNSQETWQVASDRLSDYEFEFVNNGTDSVRIAGEIQMAFQATQDACSAVKVREQIPAQQIKKSGAPKTTTSGGAALTYPKTLDVGKKPKKLPVNVKSPGTGYSTISVTRGSKGIVATGGWVEPGTFGLLMTVPAKTKTGKVTLTFTLEGGPTVKGTVRLK